MTVMGQHTVTETYDLMKTVEFRIKAGDKVNNQITEAQINANLQGFTETEEDWTKFKARWATRRDDVLLRLFLRNQANPLVPASMISSEPEYKLVKQAINVGGGDTYAKGDLMDCLLRIEKIAALRIDEKDAPLPAGFDPDLAAYKKVDDSIKAGEQAASVAADAAKGAATKVPWYVWAGGIAIVGGVGLAYASPFLPHPRR